MGGIYNFHYSISALAVGIIIFGFFLARRKLPIRQNKIFMYALVVQLLVTVTDILASAMDNQYEKYTVGLLYLMNMAYFVFYVARVAAFFMYALTVTYAVRHPISKKEERWLLLPFAVYEIFILSAPFTDFTFRIDPLTGYQRSWGYNTIYYIFFFYIAMTLFVVILNRNKLTRLQFGSFIVYCIALTVGNFMRYLFPYVLIMDSFSQIAIVIIYLSLQNPDFFIEKQTSLFDMDAFREITDEWIVMKQDFSCFCFYIDKYDDMRNIYDVIVMNHTLLAMGSWLNAKKKDNLIFYFGDGRFVAAGRNEEMLKDYSLRIIERFHEHWSVDEKEIHLSIQSGFLNTDVVRLEAKHLMELLHFFFSEGLSDKSHIVSIDNDLIQRMYRAKNVEKALDRAIKKNSIQVWYQPIYSYQTGKYDSAEALVRLDDEELGRIMPGEFIERAEKTGQIIPLGRQIFRKVCEFIRDEKLENMGIEYIHVNLSPIQCMDDMLAEQLLGDMQTYGIDPEMIEFEITETATLETEDFYRNLKQLAKLGRGLALDDYGTGATNLNRMLQLHINMVKIDREIFTAFYEKEDVSSVESLVNMFHNQRLKVVVEGIETESMTKMARDARVDLAQGYFYAKPLNESDYLAFLERNK